MTDVLAPSSTRTEVEALRARLAAREERLQLVEEENRWLKAQPTEQLNWLSRADWTSDEFFGAR